MARRRLGGFGQCDPNKQEKIMSRILKRFGASVAALLMLAMIARAEEDNAEKIPFDKAPKAIRDAINNRFPDAEVSSIEKEKEGGKVVFDVELKHKGRKYEMDIEEDGTIIEIEKEVALKDVPKALIKNVKAKFPEATIKEVMEVNKVKGKEEKPDHYEVTIETSDNKTKEVNVSLTGKIITKEGGDKDKG
jgi:uncharacterized membrane protein YkoI